MLSWVHYLGARYEAEQPGLKPAPIGHAGSSLSGDATALAPIGIDF